MEEKGSLGIYLLKDKAVAVWTSTETNAFVLHKIAVTPSADEPATLALQAARAVRRQGYPFDEVFVAIDCSCYTQYNLHSEFEDVRQIESTIKFDAEEAAATDAMNLAVTFEVTNVLQTGSEVTVYTADRQLLTDILLDIQEGALDPTLLEPDVVCLRRALEQTVQLSDCPESLFIVLSGSNCYMLRPNPGHAPTVRTFLVQAGSDVTNTLIREVLLATATGQQTNSLKSAVLIGNLDAVDTKRLYDRTGLEVLTETPEHALLRKPESENQVAGQLLVPREATDESITPAELLIAYGAAMAARSRGHKADFRKDFMPYQGKRKVMEGSLRLIGISLTILLLAVAIFFQLKTFNMKGYRQRLEDKNLEQYKAVMLGKSPPRAMNPSTKLKSVHNQVQTEKNGLGTGDNTSAPAMLTFFLQAVNDCEKRVDIQIQQITITEKSMKVKGDTNSRTSTNVLLNKIKKHEHLSLGTYRYDKEAKRDSFEITIKPKE